MSRRALRGDSRRVDPSDGAATAFTPDQNAKTVGWWRADLGITLAISPATTVWANQIAGDTNKNWSQGTIALQPVWTAADASFNNQSSLDFATAGVATRYMAPLGTWSAAAYPQPLTIIAVAIEGGATVAGNRAALDCTGANRLTINSAGTTGTPGLLGGSLLNSSGTWKSAAAIMLGEFNNASSTIFHNSATSGTAGTVASANTLRQLAVGGRSTPEFRGKIAEVILCNAALTVAEKRLYVDYLSARYNIAVT